MEAELKFLKGAKGAFFSRCFTKDCNGQIVEYIQPYMKLIQSTWQEIDAYLATSDGIIIPTGSIEQHGPMGLIGTDMLCANDISVEAGELAKALVAPPLGYAPAEFNMGFVGTISISPDIYQAYVWS